MTDWNKDLEKNILMKAKFTLTLRILRVLFFIFLIYGVYIILTNIFAEKLNVTNENMYFSSLALEWTVPNVRSDFNVKEEELTAFGTNHFSYDLMKTVGEKESVIGEARVTKKVSDAQSRIDYFLPGRKQLSEFSFSLPEDPRTGKKLTANTSSYVWESLEMLPEGTVVELAFSTTSFMESKQLIEALKDLDLHILWMPLYTGQFKHYEPSHYSLTNDMIIVSELGLTGGKEHHDSFHESFRIRWLADDTINESEQMMLKNMEKLLNKSESYYEQFLGLEQLKEKYQYLTEEGFIVYGAVVTGPVKELLKLQQLSFVQGEQLGEVELWNWRQGK